MAKRPPKLYRRKKAGKFIGSWFVNVKGVAVNLETKDADIARGRRTEAVRGKREFQADADAVAEAITTEAAPPAPPAQAPAALVALELEDPEAPAEPAVFDPVADDESGEPGEPVGAGGWAEAVNDAAGGGGGDDEAPPPGPDAGAFRVTMEDVLRALGRPPEEVAPWVVEKQIELGAFVGKLRGRVAKPIAKDALPCQLLVAGYVPVIRDLQLLDLSIHPGWLILLGSAGILFQQFAGSEKIAGESEASPAQAAA